MTKSLKAGFMCQKCGFKTTDVPVRERAATEDIQNYVHYIGRMCGDHHSIRSPYCGARQFDIMIPMTQAGIGFDGPPLTNEDQEQLREQLK